MGSLTGNAGALAAFTGQPFPNGLDLGRCVILQDLGIFVADPAASFKAGQMVNKGANGIGVPSDGKGILGVAKWNKVSTLTSVAVDEEVVLTGTAAQALKHGNVSNVKVAKKTDGTAYTVTTHYTVSAANGTVTRVAVGGGPADGEHVLVSYTYDISSQMLDFQGRNFWNFLDDVTIQDGHITVIVDWSILFTTQYDTAQVYTLTGTGSNLYCGATSLAGLFTNQSGGDFVGRVLQVPSATDPYLGVVFGGTPVVVT